MKRRANQEGQTLENKIAVDIQEANQAIAQLRSNITGLKSTVNNVVKNTGIKALTGQVNQAKKSTSAWSKTWSAIEKTINFSAIYLGAKQAFNALKGMNDEAVDYAETVNLFNVSMGKGIEGLNQYYEEAINFQEKLEEKLGINIEESMRYQALFNSMTKSMGLGANYAYTLSENMTKLGYDLASLYNIDTESAMTKLRAGLAGQTEPLRELGLDITEQSLKPVAESLGVNESIRNMSQAEKAVLRYITVLRQAKIAWGDFARTTSDDEASGGIASVANQLRIFDAQVTSLKRNIGNLWQGLLGNILPYVNAIVMVINELLKMVAKLFGFEVSSQPVNVSASIGADDLANDLGTAGKKAKELKAQLMGFDEINNINLDNDSSSGSGSSSGGGAGIDQRLLDALKGYDNMMDSISNKATEIRDKILDWLGVTDGTYKNLKRIGEIAGAIGIALGTWKISSAVTNLLKNLGVLKGKQSFQLAFGITLLATGIFAQYKGTKHLLDGDVDLFTLLETFLGTSAGALGLVNILKATKLGKSLSLGNKLKFGFGVMLGIQGVQVFLDGINEGDIKKTLLGAFEGITSLSVAFNGLFGKKLTTSIKNTIGSISSFGIMTVSSFKNARASGLSLGQSFIQAGKDGLNLVPTSVKVAGGLAGIVSSGTLAYKAMEDLKEGSISSDEALLKFTGSLAGATVSGALLGSTFGPVGTVIGGIAGACTSVVSGLLGLREEAQLSTEEFETFSEKVEDFTASYQESANSIKDSMTSKLDDLEVTKTLSNELDNLVETNGRVKEGNEERVDFILSELNSALGLELSRNGDLITKNGEVVNSYKSLKDNIEEVIESKKREAEAEAYTELYKQSIKDSIEAKRQQREAQEEYNKALKEYQDRAQYLVDNPLDPLAYIDFKKAETNLNDMEETLNQTNDNVQNLSSDMQYYSEQMTNCYIEGTNKVSEEMIKQQQVSSETLQNMVNSNTQAWEENYNNMNTSTQAMMLAQSTTIDNWSPILQQKWKDMATKDRDEYNNALAELPENTRVLVETITNTTGELSPEQIQKWKDMATNSKDEYNKALSSLPQDTQLLIETITNTTGKLSPEQIQKWADLARNDKNAYENNLTGLDETTKSRIQSCVDAVNNKQWSAEEASRGLADAVEKGVNTIDTTEAGKQAVNGVAEGINKNKNSWNLWDSLKSLKDTVVNGLKSLLGIHSPSTILRDLVGRFIPLGIAEGIDKESNSVYSSIERLNKGIRVKTSDFKIDTTQFIDYGAIAGNINTQAKVEMRDLPQEVSQAVIEGMKNVSIPIEIEARTDEGVVFKKVQVKAREYEMQTGQPAF